MTDQIHFWMAEQDQDDLEAVMQHIGLTSAEAFRLFAKKAIEVDGLPFEISQPTPRLEAAFKSHDYTEFADSQEGLIWLNNENN